MKKILSFILFSLITLSASAQVVSATQASKVRSNLAKTIDAGENQLWWGYGDITSLTQYSRLGTTQLETYNVDMLITGDNPIVVGNTIKAIRIAFHDKSVIKDVKVWLSTVQPASANEANVCCVDVNADDIKDLQNDNVTVDVALPEAYTVTDAGVYVGYTFTVTDNSNAAQYPIVMIPQEDVPNSHFLMTAAVGGDWMDATSFGMSSIMVLVEGDFPENKISVEDFANVDLIQGETGNIGLVVKNLGANKINNVSYTVTGQGTTSQETTINTEIGIGLSSTILVPINAGENLGTYDYTITITKVNGVAVEGVESKGQVTVIGELKEWPRKVLIEEFTTEPCTYCPDAAAGLESFHNSYPDVANQTTTICHHAGYLTDWLTIPASRSYTWFYGPDGTYAPAFMWDRYRFSSNSKPVPVEGRPSGGSGHKNKVDQRLAVNSLANIEISAEPNDNKSKVTVTIDCERGKTFGSDIRLTVFLTEDNVPARNQSGASGSFIHQHVARACNATWGEQLNWVNNKATYTYTFDISNSWEYDELKVVAFLSNYDSNDRTNCVVEQSADLSLASQPNGISETVQGSVLREEARYTIDGRQLSKPEPGINIVRLSNGETVKVLVK